MTEEQLIDLYIATIHGSDRDPLSQYLKAELRHYPNPKALAENLYRAAKNLYRVAKKLEQLADALSAGNR